jgi:uncharacterized protein (DUF433 family)
MQDSELLQRITTHPTILVGKPVIRGTRLAVEHILNLLAHGASATEVIDEYPGITLEDIQACLLFAAKSLSASTYMPLALEST